jgi:hypothetical protein
MDQPDRRAVLGSAAGGALLAALPGGWSTAGAVIDPTARLACCIRYLIDPATPSRFGAYASLWASAARRSGGLLIGIFRPEEGTNNVALAVVAFANLAAYEAFETRMTTDPDAKAAARLARDNRLILSEHRSFLRPV